MKIPHLLTALLCLVQAFTLLSVNAAHADALDAKVQKLAWGKALLVAAIIGLLSLAGTVAGDALKAWFTPSAAASEMVPYGPPVPPDVGTVLMPPGTLSGEISEWKDE